MFLGPYRMQNVLHQMKLQENQFTFLLHQMRLQENSVMHPDNQMRKPFINEYWSYIDCFF
jgi:hypothetical protein